MCCMPNRRSEEKGTFFFIDFTRKVDSKIFIMKSLDMEFFDGFVSNVCQYNFSFQVVKNKTLESIEKLLGAINERFRLKDPTVTNCYERLDGIPESDLKEKCIYHSECYK